MSDAKGLRYEVLDVFAEAPLEGNPLAVVFGAERLSTTDMQAIARETNLSETSFVLHGAARDGAFDARIFTPARELPYAAASIVLDGADTTLFHLIQECPVAEVRMGMRVRAVWAAERGPSLESIDHFKPAGEPDAPYDAYKEHL